MFLGLTVIPAILVQRYANYWLRLQTENGFYDQMKEKWLQANPTLNQGARRSILRNVLGVGLD